uniref:DNA repair protein RadC n=1 Tax=Candidatus Kentrum sp. MB TaxID=2138164 RepID=A0A450XUA3_9GAMM|nr:MAG: DNA repair protein RadC [Candidatus Kentron sp. MB]VFK32880.1 MAG: DNA repair protein RadC [Candidatus Kentron sp. MB]VFK75923.1 MAG: DNA repair protein RadC [Candidatus Kentron sp. MB]
MEIKITEQEKIRVADGQDIFDIMRWILLREERLDQDKEHFQMVGLDVGNRLLFIELIVIGGSYHANIRPVEAFRVSVLKNAVSVILVHNHPGGIVKPSEADKDTTDHLIQVGRILNIRVLDHLIISPETFFSFEMGGLMEALRESLKYVPPYEIADRIKQAEEKEGLRRVREVARAMLGDGMPVDDVVRYSGLDREDVERMARVVK